MNQTKKLINQILDYLSDCKLETHGSSKDYSDGWNDAVKTVNGVVQQLVSKWYEDQENMINRDYEAEINTLKQKLEEFAYQNNISHSALAKKEKRIKEMSGVISAIKVLADIEFESIKGDY